jgi:hypothetical protein
MEKRIRSKWLSIKNNTRRHEPKYHSLNILLLSQMKWHRRETLNKELCSQILTNLYLRVYTEGWNGIDNYSILTV